MRQCCHQLPDAFLDPLGDDDLALTGEQLYRAHFAHVHAHRISCAACFLLNGSQRGSRLCSGDFVRRAVALAHQQLVGVGRLLEHLNTHVIDHLNDVFNLIGIRDVLREVIIDFSVGQVPLLFSLCNQGFK